MTVGQWFAEWLAECADRLEPSTLAGYRSAVEAHIRPAIGSIRLRDLRRHHVEDMRALGQPAVVVATRDAAVLAFLTRHPGGVRTREVIAEFGPAGAGLLRQLVRAGTAVRVRRGVYAAAPGAVAPSGPVRGAGRGGRHVEQRQPRTIDGVRRVLRAGLGVAVDRGMIVTNPAQGRMSVIPKIGKSQASWWEPEQVRAFLDSVAADRLSALWVVAAFTGLRRSELCGIRWADVDLRSKTPGITVNQRVSCVSGERPCVVCGGAHVGRQIRARAKSDAGLRWVPLTAEAVRELLAHRAAQEAERAAWGSDYSDHDLVFAMEDGTPLRPDWLTRRHGALVADAGLPRIVLHEMRHGAVSLLLAAGMPLELVALVVGHAGRGAITQAVYAHTLKAPASAAAEAAADLTRPPGGAHSVHAPRKSDADRGGGDAAK
jgi:integrase